MRDRYSLKPDNGLLRGHSREDSGNHSVHAAEIPGESKRLAELREFLLPLLMNSQVTIGDDGK